MSDFDEDRASGAYGEGVAQRFGLRERPYLRTSSFQIAEMAMTWLDSGATGTGLTGALPDENAYIVSLQLKPLTGNRLWRNGKLESGGGFQAGEVGVVNLRDAPQADLPNSYSSVQLYVPDVLLQAMADRHEISRLSALRFQASTPDPFIHQLVLHMLPRFSQDGAARQGMFFDHVGLAIQLHLARTYGDAVPPKVAPTNILAGWQLRRTLEMLTADLVQEPRLDEVALACRLPPERFVRAFRRTMGMAPHAWLRFYRLRQAREMVERQGGLALVEIANACGFADQAHMTRRFVAQWGAPPSRLRAG